MKAKSIKELVDIALSSGNYFAEFSFSKMPPAVPASKSFSLPPIGTILLPIPIIFPVCSVISL